jgi:hypothetical protein
LDTREKIVPIGSLRRLGEKWKVVVGYFDPLYASGIGRLREICGEGQRIIVIVADRPDAILPLRARAELVAALQCVERVATCNDDPISAASETGAREILDELHADERRAVELSALIADRYKK